MINGNLSVVKDTVNNILRDSLPKVEQHLYNPFRSIHEKQPLTRGDYIDLIKYPNGVDMVEAAFKKAQEKVDDREWSREEEVRDAQERRGGARPRACLLYTSPSPRVYES